MLELDSGSMIDHEILGTSPWAMQVREQIRRAAVRNANVLILGPTGTGKDRIARAIHNQGHRPAEKFLVVDCASAGAECFTEQFFCAADGGTIFLDEVGDLESTCQARLLRALEIGSRGKATSSNAPSGKVPSLKHPKNQNSPMVDVRVVAASNRNLAAEVASGRFRADLYYRLKVITIDALPLHARPEDILILANHFLHEIAACENEAPRNLSPAAEAKLLSQPWPGNVRELRNVMERAVAFSDGATIEADLIAESDPILFAIAEQLSDFDDPHSRQILSFNDSVDEANTSEAPAAPGLMRVKSLEAEAAASQMTRSGQSFRMLTAAENERIQILTAMQMANNNQSHAASLLGMTRQQLRRRIAKHFPDSMPAKRGRPRLPKAA